MSCPPTFRSMGCLPMQGIWWANRPISTQPCGQKDFRAVCFVTKSAKATSLGLDFAPRIPSRESICATPSNLRTSSKNLLLGCLALARVTSQAYVFAPHPLRNPARRPVFRFELADLQRYRVSGIFGRQFRRAVYRLDVPRE